MIPIAAIVGASRYEKNPGRFVALCLTGFGSAFAINFMYPRRDTVFADSGIYEITASKPKSLKSVKEQHDICANYVSLFEKSQDICVDCRPQLKKLCGINPDEVLTNLRLLS